MADKLKQVQDVQKNLKTITAGIRKVTDAIKSMKKDGACAKGGECEAEHSAVVRAGLAVAGATVAVVGLLAMTPATLGASIVGALTASASFTVANDALNDAIKKWQECLKKNNDPGQREAANLLKQVSDLRAKMAKEHEQLKKLK